MIICASRDSELAQLCLEAWLELGGVIWLPIPGDRPRRVVRVTFEGFWEFELALAKVGDC